MILVTGATGHLGSHLLYQLAKENKPVRALFRDHHKIDTTKKIFSFYDPDYNRLLEKIEWFNADINDFYTLLSAMEGVSTVFHTAGFVSFNDHDIKKLNLVNVRGTANVVNACLEAGVKKLCHVSSIASLGETVSNEIITEDLIWNQVPSASAYAKSKFHGEMEVWRGIYEGLNAVIVNPSVIIGPGIWMGPGKELFYNLYKEPKFFPVGSSGYVDVRDVARIMILLTEGNYTAERFIVNAENTTHENFIKLVAEILGHPAPNIRVTPFLAKVAVLAEHIHAFLTASSPRINQGVMEIASENLTYSNEKILNIPGVNFISLKESVKITVALFMNEIQKAK